MASLFHPSEILRLKPIEPAFVVWLRGLALACVFSLISLAPLGAQTAKTVPDPIIPDGPAAETVLETLWRNNLYEIANEVCLAQVKLQSADSDSRIRWQCWLIRGLASEAIDVEDRSPPDLEKAKANWAQIETIHQEIQSLSPIPFRGLWVRWQYLHAIHLRSQGAMARYLANPLDSVSRDEALSAIRELDRGAEVLQKSIAEMVATNSASTTAQARKQIRELQELSTETSLLRCEALALRGQAYPLQSADAIAAGTEMEQFAIEAAGKIATDWSGRSKLELALAISKWLQGNRSETLQRSQVLLRSEDSRVRLRALDLLIQAALQSDDRDLAEQTLKQFQSPDATPEFALAQLRLALYDLPNDATAPSLRQQAMTNLLASRDAIGQRFGGYWQRRAEALLLSVTKAGSAMANRNSNEATELVRIEVRQLLTAKRTEEAIGKLLQQAALLQRNQTNDVAMQLTLQAAAIFQKEKNWNRSGDLFKQAAVKFPMEKDASAAHLMAIYCITQAIRNSPAEPSLWSKLDELFVEQLELFPEDPASLQAAKQYAQSANYRRVWHDAANKMRPHIANVFFAHDLAWLVVELEMRGIAWQYAESDPRTVEIAKKCFDQWRQWSASLDQDASKESLRNLGAAAQVVLSDLLPEMLTRQMQRNQNLDSFRSQWLKNKLRDDEAGFAWQEAWRIASQAKQDIAAKRTLTAQSIGSLGRLLQLRESSDPDNGQNPGQATSGLEPTVALWCAIEVMLESLELLSPSERSAARDSMAEMFGWLQTAHDTPSWKVASAEKFDLLRWRLGAFDKNRQQYVVLLDEKIQRQPRVAIWQKTKALLLETGDTEELEEALGLYRKLAAGAKNGSDEWLRARYRSALCLLWLKKVEDAKQAAEVILLTHPPTDPIWVKRLEALKNHK
jgi:hypothetical protein